MRRASDIITHPLIPHRPCICLVVADIGVGKTSLLAHVAAVKSSAGKRVLYIVGEGSPKDDIEPLLIVAGANMANIALVDCVVEHASVRLEDMLKHDAIGKLVPNADCVILDPLSSFESEAIKRHKIRQRLAQFHALTRQGVTVFIAMHPNRTRTVRRPLDLVPSGWAGNAEICWQLEASDQNGHAVLEMTRGRHYPPPWKRYAFWLGTNANGVAVAVISDEPTKSIAELLREKNPNHVPRSVAAARQWVLAHLAEHGPRLVETEIFPAGNAAGHSEPALVKAKAISREEIGHTHQGTGPSKWFLSDRPGDSVESVSDKAVEQNQRNPPVEETCWSTDKKIMDAIHEVLGPAALDPASPAKPVYVQCLKSYAKERGQDGQSLSWIIPDDGRSWLWFNGPWNAPKGEPNSNPAWADKLLAEMACGNVPRAATLWPYSADTDWFKNLMAVRDVHHIRFTRRGLKFGDAKKGPRERVFALLMFGLTSEEVATLRESLKRNGVDVVPVDPRPEGCVGGASRAKST